MGQKRLRTEARPARLIPLGWRNLENKSRKDFKESSGVENSNAQSGVIFRMLGVTAIILGLLDSMLSWRGGFELNSFYLALMLGGAMLFIAGSLMRNR